MEEGKEAIKQKIRQISRKYYKRIISAIVVIVVILMILLPASVYHITVEDGTYKDEDWSSTPYGASEYTRSVSVNESDGTLSSGTTAQDLWDKLLEGEARVDEYLKSPEELARLMKAEIVTQYPDTRPNPDEEIDWDAVIEDPDALQGIIKFKRAQSDGTTSTMKYVTPEKLYEWIELYSETGNETYKELALNSFTLSKNSISQSNDENSYEASLYTVNDIMTDKSEAIVNAAKSVSSPGSGLCQAWVRLVYAKAGLGNVSYATAYQAFKSNCVSKRKDNIPVGAAVYGTGSGSSKGHVGIYIGNGKVMDNVGYIKTQTLEEWIAWQERKPTAIPGVEPGWLGWGWQAGSPNIISVPDSSSGEETQEATTNTNNQGATTVEQGSIPLKILFVGNSKTYKENIPGKFKELAKAGGYNVSVTSVTDAGKSLNYLASNYKNQINQSYDIVILQEQSDTYRKNYSTFLSGAKSISDMVKAKNPDVKIFVRQTWVYKDSDTSTINKAYQNAENVAAEIGASLIYDGKAMYQLNDSSLFQDNIHQSNSGAYLSACCIYSSLFGKSPVGLSYTGGLSEATAKQLQTTAYNVTPGITTSTEEEESSSSENTVSYSAVVATWEQIDTTVTSDDPNVEPKDQTLYTMTTTNINYKEMVKSYTMPFDLLWALLVVGEDKNFIFELTDLVYNSDIQITIHDNLTVNTDIDEWHYTEEIKAIVDATITASCYKEKATSSIENDVHDPYKTTDYTTTKKVVTQTNTLDIALTRANVWMLDYQNNYTYESAKTNTTTSKATEADTKYPSQPNSTGDSFSCEHISSIKEELKSKVQTAALENPKNMPTIDGTPIAELPESVHVEQKINVKYYNRYTNIYDNITNIETTQRYIAGSPTTKGKDEIDSEEPNFVTIFRKVKYKANKSRILDYDQTLFEIMELNDSTSGKLLDLIKYLLYKATDGHSNYGITEDDNIFDEFAPSSFSNVTGIYGNTVQEKVWFTLRAAGYSEIATAAVMGNIELESGFSANAIEKGTGAGFGLCQWTSDRRVSIESYAKSQGQSAGDVDLQIRFLIAELTRGGGDIKQASYQLGGRSSSKYDGTRYTSSDWENATDLNRATTAFMALFERPSYDSSVNHLSRRKEAAKKYYDQFKGKEAPTGASGSSLQVANGTSAQKLKFLFPNRNTNNSKSG